MALDALLKIVGQSQGAIRGAVTTKGHEGAIRVAAVNHRLVSPRDAATGQATGKRQHHEITITKEVDAATPKLLAAWVSNETMTTWKLDLQSVDPTGRTVVAYTIELANAALTEVELILPSTYEPANASVPAHEKVSFVYAAITWTWAGSIVASDRWMEVA